MGPYRVAACTTHSRVDSGWVGTKIASWASGAVLQPPTSFQAAKCGAGWRKIQMITASPHPPYNEFFPYHDSFPQLLLTGGRGMVWRCPVDRTSLRDKSDSLLCVCFPSGCCRCPQGKETGCHMQSLVIHQQQHVVSTWMTHNYSSANKSLAIKWSCKAVIRFLCSIL